MYREIDNSIMSKAKANQAEYVSSLLGRVFTGKRRESAKRGK